MAKSGQHWEKPNSTKLSVPHSAKEAETWKETANCTILCSESHLKNKTKEREKPEAGSSWV